MHEILLALIEKLKATSIAVGALGDSRQSASEIWGWNLPSISPFELKEIPLRLVSLVEKNVTDDLNEEQIESLAELNRNLDSLNQNLIPNLPSNPAAGIPPYLQTMTYISNRLGSTFTWITPDPSSLPASLVRKLQKTERELARLAPSKLNLTERIAEIVEAHEAAQALPTTMQELKDTQSEIRQISKTSSEFLGKIEEDRINSIKNVERIQEAKNEGAGYLDKLSAAYSAATTQGLAAAFEERARKLNFSVALWVAALACSLVVLMLVGYYRLNAMQAVLVDAIYESNKVWVQIILSAFSVGAPVWFSWMATKQISQRFRLAEDYAFKASVAKAYEGFRKEAIRIDPEMEKRLFSSALNRLDEAPLRLMEMTTHGSPLHEATAGYLKEKTSEGISKIVDKLDRSKNQKTDI